MLDGASLSSPDRMSGASGTFAVAPCSQCGLGITLPLVEPDELGGFYPSAYGAHERSLTGISGLISAVVQRLMFLRLLRNMPMKRLAELPAGRLLDVGCGRGNLGAQLVQRGWRVVGVEPSPEACQVARGRGVDAHVGTLADVELELEAYDVVVFNQSLEHIVDPVSDLRRACEALRDGGMLIVSVPNFGSWQRHLFGGSWFHLDLPRHRCHFDDDALRATLERAGFAHIRTDTSYCNHGLPASIQYLIFDRCLFPGGWRLRLAVMACAPLGTLSWLFNRLGSGDLLHAVAYRE